MINIVGIKNKLFYILPLSIIMFLSYPGLIIEFSCQLIGYRGSDIYNILGITASHIDSSIFTLFHLPFLYPVSFLLTGTHPLIGQGLLFKLFDLMGLSIIQSHNLFLIIGLLVAATGSILLAGIFTKNKFIKLSCGLIAMLPNLTVLFIWSNFFTSLWLPLLIYFLLKYLNKGNYSYLLSFACLLLFLSLSSIYISVPFWIFILAPIFFFHFFFQETKNKEETKKIIILLLTLLIVAIILIVFLHPMLKYKFYNISEIQLQKEKRFITIKDILINRAMIFTTKSFKFLSCMHNFPGITIALLTIICFTLKIKKYAWLLRAFLTNFLIIVFFLLYYKKIFFAELIFTIILIILLLSFLYKIKDYAHNIKITLSTLMVFFVFHYVFISAFSIDNFCLGYIVYKLPFLKNLIHIRRITPMLLPFIVIIISYTLEQFTLIKFKINNKYLLYPFMTLMIAENMLFKTPFIGEKDTNIIIPAIYKELEKRKVMLELPYYKKVYVKNSFYMFNSSFHKCYLLNGKVSAMPKGYLEKLFRIIGDKNLNCFNPQSIKKLKEEYNLTYILIHKKRFFYYSKINQEKLNELLEKNKNFLQILKEDENHTLLKINYLEQNKKFIRTFASYELNNNKHAVAIFNKPLKKLPLKITINNKIIPKNDWEINNNKLKIKKIPKNITNIMGNRCEIILEKKQILKDFTFEN